MDWHVFHDRRSAATAAGRQAQMRRRNEAWRFFLQAAAPELADVPIARRRLSTKRVTMPNLCGLSARELATRFEIKMRTVAHFRSVLADLFEIADMNGSPASEVFGRFQEYPVAYKRVRNHRKLRKGAAQSGH